jgi:HD-GYP domain-containing protein (c-di-GMP phosphodiesterase class II)
MTLGLGGDPVRRLRTLGPRFGEALLLFGPMVVAFAYLMPAVPEAVLLATFATAASHQLLVTVSRSRSFEQMLSDLSAEIPGSLLAALDAADSYTAQHSASVASYSYDLGRAYGYDDRRARQVHAAALLHDVGKIGVPDAVLTKPGKLDDSEWEMMQRHPEIGANIVRRLPGFHLLEGGILHHHERMNGQGYPAGIRGAAIPEDAQIIAVADTYSAITTSRAYRQAKPPEYAISELRKDAKAGKLNVQLVELFLASLEARDENYRTGRHTSLRHEITQVRGWLNFADGSISQAKSPSI